MKIHVIQSILKTINEQFELACNDLRHFFLNKDGHLDGETDVIPEESEPDCSPLGVPDGVPAQNYSSKVSENSAGVNELLTVAARVLAQLESKSMKEQEVLEFIADNTNLSTHSQEVFKNLIWKYWQVTQKIEFMRELSEKYEKISIGSLMKALPALMKKKAPLSFGFYEQAVKSENASMAIELFKKGI